MSDVEPPKVVLKPRVRRPPGLAGILREGEKVRQVAVIHWGIFWKTAAVFLLALVLLIKAPPLGIFMLAVTAVMFVVAWLTRYYLLLLLTDSRIIVRGGVLQLETVQLHYNKIESVELFWTLMGRMLGYATVMVTGVGSRVTMVPFVGNAVAFRTELDRLLTVQEDKPIKVEAVTPAEQAPGPI